MKTFGAAYFAIISACALLQFGLGGSPALILTLYVISATGLVIAAPGGQGLASLIYFGYVLYSGVFALIIKTLLLQPVQQNLMAPFDTALVLLGGHICLTIAYGIYRAFPARLAVLEAMEREFSSPAFLQFISKIGFVVGFFLMLLHTIFRPKFVNGVSTAEGFGGFGTFYFLLLVGFTAQCALAVARKNRAGDITIAFLMFSAMLVLSIISNQKKYIFDAIVIVALIMIAYRVKIRTSYLVAGLAFVIFTQFVLSPLIHIARSESTQRTISERAELTIKILEANDYDLARINQINDRISRSFERSYRSSGSYVYPSTLNLDRFMLVLPIDQVVRVDEPGRLGWSQFGRFLAERVLPGALIQKQAAALSDEVAWAYGFRQHGVVARPVVGLTATGWAVGGVAGLVVLGILVPVMLFWVLGAIGGQIYRNPWTVAIFMVVSLAPEQDASGVAGMIIRGIPITLTAIGLLMLAARRLQARGVVSYKRGPMTLRLDRRN